MHLPFDRFDSVDVAFDDAGAVGQGEAGSDGLEVLADGVGEDADGVRAAQLGLWIQARSRWPRRWRSMSVNSRARSQAEAISGQAFRTVSSWATSKGLSVSSDRMIHEVISRGLGVTARTGIATPFRMAAT